MSDMALPSDRAAGLRPQPPAASSQSSIPSANGPELWSAILARMPSGSIIAGGAVRDYLNGVEPKDIDVFIDIEADARRLETDDAYALKAGDARFGLHRIDNEYERFEEYAAVSNIACVSSGMMFGHRVDAVVMEKFKGGADLVAGFDFGLNRVWFDGEIHDTPEAYHDRENNCATLLLNDRVERSLKRFARLNERWGGGWRLVIPAQGIEARSDETPQAVQPEGLEPGAGTACAQTPSEDTPS
jgi:hypothetical protein